MGYSLLEEAEEIIKRESFFDYESEKHRRQLGKIMAGETKTYFFDPYCRFLEKGKISLVSKKELKNERETFSRKIEDGITHIAVRGFLSLRTVNDIFKALQKANHTNPRIVLDLRDNPGGLTHYCLLAVCLFAKGAEDVLVTKKFKNYDELVTVRHMSPFEIPGPFSHYKVVVLINNRSVSAAEPVAGILKELGFPVVGEKSYGKGVAQRQFLLSDGSVLRITIFEVLLGNKRTPLNKVGIEPDYYVRDNRKIFLGLTGTKKDRQFMKAVEVLKKMK